MWLIQIPVTCLGAVLFTVCWQAAVICIIQSMLSESCASWAHSSHDGTKEALAYGKAVTRCILQVACVFPVWSGHWLTATLMNTGKLTMICSWNGQILEQQQWEIESGGQGCWKAQSISILIEFSTNTAVGWVWHCCCGLWTLEEGLLPQNLVISEKLYAARECINLG